MGAYGGKTGVADRLSLISELLRKDGAQLSPARLHSVDALVTAYCQLHDIPLPETSSEKRKLLDNYLVEVAIKVIPKVQPFREYKPDKAMQKAVERCREPVQVVWNNMTLRSNHENPRGGPRYCPKRLVLV